MKIKRAIKAKPVYEELEIELPSYQEYDYSTDDAEITELVVIDKDGKRLGITKRVSWRDKSIEYDIEVTPEFFHEGSVVEQGFRAHLDPEIKQDFIDRVKDVYGAMENILRSIVPEEFTNA